MNDPFSFVLGAMTVLLLLSILFNFLQAKRIINLERRIEDMYLGMAKSRKDLNEVKKRILIFHKPGETEKKSKAAVEEEIKGYE